MGQECGTGKVGTLFAKFHCMFQHIEFGTIVGRKAFESGSLINEIQHFIILVGKSNIAGGRNTTELTEQHLRQGKTILHLGELHIGLINFDINLQTIGTSCQSLVNHLVDIIVKFRHEVTITERKTLLLLQGNNKPIGLVNVIKRILRHSTQIICSNLLSNISHLVGSDNGTTHIDRLTSHHGAHPHVTIVGVECIHDVLSDGITHLSKAGTKILEDGAQILSCSERNKSILCQSREQGAQIGT